MRPKKTKTRTPKTVFVNRQDRRVRISFRMLFTLALILLGGVGSAVTYAVISDVQHQVADTRASLADQRDVNATLRDTLSQRYSLEDIRRIATERLGMGMPDASQIIYIHVPKQSYIVLNDETPATEPRFGMLNAMISFLTEKFKELINAVL